MLEPRRIRHTTAATIALASALLASCTQDSGPGSGAAPPTSAAGSPQPEAARANVLPAASSVTLGTFALYAERSVKLGSGDTVLEGSVGVAAPAPQSFGPQLVVGPLSFADPDDSLVAPSVALGAGSLVGSVDTNALQNAGAIYGAQSALPSPLPALPLARAATTGAAAVNVGALTCHVLAPGAYGALSVSGTVVLQPGTYGFSSVTLADGGRLVAEPGGVDLRIATTLSVGRNATVAVESDSGACTHVDLLGSSASGLSISVAGVDAAGGASPAVKVGSGSFVQALLTAPNGTLSFGSSTVAAGAFAAFDIAIGDSAVVALSGGFPASAPGQQGSQQLSGYITPAMAAAPVVGPVPPATGLHVSVALPVRNLSLLQQLVQQVSDPASPTYRQYVTPDTFATSYGPLAGDYQTLQTWAQSAGLTVAGTYPNRTLVDLTGTAASIEQALHLQVVYALRPDGSQFYELDRQPSLDLGVTVLQVSGLTNFARVTPAGGTGPSGLWSSSDLRSIYASGAGCPTLTGAQQTVGILAMGGYTPASVTTFEGTFTPPSTVPVKNALFGGATGTPTAAGTADGADAETVADIELAISMAPGLSQVTAFLGAAGADAPSLFNALATTQPLVLQASTSFAMLNYAGLSGEQSLYEMAAQGQSFLYVAGDVGAYPSASDGYDWVENALVTVVGATTLTASPGAYGSEVPYVDLALNPPLATGGGCDVLFIPQPSYQTGMTLCPTYPGMTVPSRSLPDVSIVGQSVFVVNNQGQNSGYEGTSVSAPLWAGFMALANQQNANVGAKPVGFANPALYAIARASYGASFNDVTTGTIPNLLGSGAPISATTGYNQTSGWGTPKCALLGELSCVHCPASGNACIDFETDATNCGGCGHGCGGAACISGTCQTAAVLTTAPDPGGIVVGANGVYFTSYDGTSTNLLEVSKTGGTAALWGAGSGPSQSQLAIAIDAAHVYWADLAGIEQVPVGSAATPTRIVTLSTNAPPAPSDQLGGLASDGTSIYWDDDFTVWKQSLSGGAPTSLTSVLSGQVTTGLVVDQGNVYFADFFQAAVRRVPVTGGTGTAFASVSPAYPVAIAASVDGQHVYYSSEPYFNTTAPFPIMGMPVAGGTPTQLTSRGALVTAMVADATTLYWTEWCGSGGCAPGVNGPGVYKVPLSGNNQTPTLVYACTDCTPSNSNFMGPGGIAVDATKLYWTEDASPIGRVRSIAK